jgi:hypothetical protein
MIAQQEEDFGFRISDFGMTATIPYWPGSGWMGIQNSKFKTQN